MWRFQHLQTYLPPTALVLHDATQEATHVTNDKIQPLLSPKNASCMLTGCIRLAYFFSFGVPLRTRTCSIVDSSKVILHHGYGLRTGQGTCPQQSLVAKAARNKDNAAEWTE